MTDKETEVQAEGDVTAQDSGATPAEAQNTATPAADSGAEHMIPKSRFDEINKRFKDLQKQVDAAERERKNAEEKALAEQGKYRELYEQAQAQLEQAQTQLQQEQRDARRREVAQKAGYPELWSRLQGDTPEELEADMQALIDAIPKPRAPELNGAAGNKAPTGGGGEPSFLNGRTLQEFAARYGLRAEYLKGEK